jgi:c-di-GMP-binding flagellar brake protein YcgR
MYCTLIHDDITDLVKEICKQKNIKTLNKIHITINPSCNFTKESIKEEFKYNLTDINFDRVQIILDTSKNMNKSAIINSVDGY